MFKKISECRSCGKNDLRIFLDLGYKPPSDRLLSKEMLGGQEETYPLQVAFCKNCSLVQILETLPPEKLFMEGYEYYSSFIPALLHHSKNNVMELIESRRLNQNSFVVELASNDGYLLKNYIAKGIPVLGIDPAVGQSKAAEKNGVPTLNTFFTKDIASQLHNDKIKADVIHANNVLAHVENTNDFVEGIRILLKKDGLAVLEVPYVKDLIDKCEFDTIYHEHLCYFSVTALNKLFRQHSLYLNEVKKLSIHGGSLRLYVEPIKNIGMSVGKALTKEKEIKIDKIEYYSNFGDKVKRLKKDLRRLILSLKRRGKKIAAYGAAAKGTMMINYLEIGKNEIDFVVDRNKHKHGKYMAGRHLPIFGTEKLMSDMPDYTFILAWNFADEIIKQQDMYLKKGGHFIIPLPELKII